MKKSAAFLFCLLAIAACNSGTTSTTTAGGIAPPRTNVDEAKVKCVASGGFLVPSGNDFACRFDGGQVVSLSQL